MKLIRKLAVTIISRSDFLVPRDMSRSMSEDCLISITYLLKMFSVISFFLILTSVEVISSFWFFLQSSVILLVLYCSPASLF